MNTMNKWRTRYDELAQNFGDSSDAIDCADVKNYLLLQDLVVKIVEERKPDVILDVGSGHGMFTEPLARRNCVYGLDFSFQQLRIAQQRQLRCIQSDALSLPFQSNTSDVTLCMGMIQLLPTGEDVRACLAEVKRVTKPGGLMLLSTINAESLLRRVYGLFVKDLGVRFEQMFALHDLYALFRDIQIPMIDTYFFYTPVPIYKKTMSAGLSHRLLSSTFLLVGQKA